jgi:hypothetical protein
MRAGMVVGGARPWHHDSLVRQCGFIDTRGKPVVPMTIRKANKCSIRFGKRGEGWGDLRSDGRRGQETRAEQQTGGRSVR